MNAELTASDPVQSPEGSPRRTRNLAVLAGSSTRSAERAHREPLLFGQLIATGDAGTAIGFLIAAALMAVGEVVELLYG